MRGGLFAVFHCIPIALHWKQGCPSIRLLLATTQNVQRCNK